MTQLVISATKPNTVQENSQAAAGINHIELVVLMKDFNVAAELCALAW